jgi:LacI family transcriptional regulator
MITVKDVARQAGVSPGTVSNVLTGNRPVSEPTRRRVLETAEALGYQPNILARSLINRRSEALAVVTFGLGYYGPSQTLSGIEQESNGLGYSLLLSLLHRPGSSRVADELGVLTSRRVDGIVWAVPEIGDNRAWVFPDRLAQLPPIVFLSMSPHPGLPVIAADNRRGAFEATGHLLESGRRAIGLIAGPEPWWEAQERREGWRQALQQAGSPADDSLVAGGDWSARSGERSLRALLEQRPQTDAVFACNDQMALGAIRAAHKLGRRIPDDLAVAGFDNIPESAYFWPSLTTVEQRLAEVGRLAVRELHRIITSRQRGQVVPEPGPTLLAPELIVRESSAHGRSLDSRQLAGAVVESERR